MYVAVPNTMFLLPDVVANSPVVTGTGSVPAPVAPIELYKVMAVVFGSTVPVVGGLDAHRVALFMLNVPFEPKLFMAVKGKPAMFSADEVTVNPSDIIPNQTVT